MASQIVQVDSVSSDLANWKVVDIDSTDGAYTDASTGHKGISVSVQSNGLYTPMDPPTVTVGLAWVDDSMGVTKYKELTFTDANFRRSSADGTTGDYVYSADQDPIVRTDGIGSCIDQRSSPVGGITRRLMIGVVASTDSTSPFYLIVTPTKIV